MRALHARPGAHWGVGDAGANDPGGARELGLRAGGPLHVPVDQRREDPPRVPKLVVKRAAPRGSMRMPARRSVGHDIPWPNWIRDARGRDVAGRSVTPGDDLAERGLVGGQSRAAPGGDLAARCPRWASTRRGCEG